ncbi:MAG: S26 family signal peptidase [Halanaeroarchaeum sp.]
MPPDRDDTGAGDPTVGASDDHDEEGSAGNGTEAPDRPNERTGERNDDGPEASDPVSKRRSGKRSGDRDEAGDGVDGSGRRIAGDDGGPEADGIGRDDLKGLVRWFLQTDHPGVTFLREFLWSALVVVLIGLLLFAISGVWPPMVAVKSGSMEPHMHRGDLVFVMDNGRFVPEEAVHGTGIVPYRVGQKTGYRAFGSYGDVIIYRKNGRTDATPIIHRARFWVSDGENWYDEANPSFVSGDSCNALPNCPAPHAGFITKGDANGQYDQVNGISEPVKPSWIKGTAEFRIPWLGHVRLKLSTLSSPSDAVDG